MTDILDAISGADLIDICRSNGWMADESRYALGVSAPALSEIVRGARRNDPVKNPSLAILGQILREMPEAAAIPHYPSSQEVYNLLQPLGIDTLRAFAILLGKEQSAGYRFLTLSAKQPALLQRLLLAIQRFLADPATRDANFQKLIAFVNLEGKARGVDDVMKTGVWNDRPRKPRKGKAKDPDAIPKKRGRKPKPVDPNAVPKKRGRPRKVTAPV